jgi:transcription-repair coupling factor (superfamily II helicase)
MLGVRQSGYIASVGFHLYARMLAQAVQELKKALPGAQEKMEKAFGIGAAHIPVSVDLPLSIGIPAEYVPDQALRLQLYRRMAGLHDESELDALQEEFIDRFGPIDEQTANLFYQIRVKLRAEKAHLLSVSAEGDQIVLRFPPLPAGVGSRELKTMNPSLRPGKNAYWFQFDEMQDDWKAKLLQVIFDIIQT